MVSSFCFQALFLALFLTLYIQTRKQDMPENVVNNPGLDNFLEELKSNDKPNLKGGNIKND